MLSVMQRPGSGPDSLWSPSRRGLTIGLVLTITLVAFEALAISTVLPIVARDLGDLEHYGWVFTSFFLGSLIGIAVVGGVINRGGLGRPLAIGLGLFAIGLLIGGLAVVDADAHRRPVHPGPGCRDDPADRLRRHRPQPARVAPTAHVRGPLDRLGAARRHRPRDRRRRRRDPRLALRLPRPAAAHRRSPASSRSGRSRRSSRAVPPPMPRSRPPLPSATGSPTPCWSRSAPAWSCSGLTPGHGGIIPIDSEPAVTLVLIVAGLLVGIPPLRRLTPPGTLTARPILPAAVLLRGVMTFTFFGVDAYATLTLESWRGLSAVAAGVVLTAATISWTAGSWIQARYAGRWSSARFVRAGLIVTVIGLISFSTILAPSVPVALAVPTFALAGLGMGLGYAPLSLIVLRESPPGDPGRRLERAQPLRHARDRARDGRLRGDRRGQHPIDRRAGGRPRRRVLGGDPRRHRRRPADEPPARPLDGRLDRRRRLAGDPGLTRRPVRPRSRLGRPARLR